VSLGRSALQHWLIMVISVVVCTSAGIAVGLIITPTYTAQAQLVVGKSLNLANTAAISGLPLAEEELAEDYSRLITTPAVSHQVGKRLGYNPSGVLSATPIAESPVIEVYGTGKTKAEALSLANAGSQALINAINTVNQETSDANQNLLTEYQDDEEQQIHQQQLANALQAQVNAAPAATASYNLLNSELVFEQAVLQTDNLKLAALQSQYEAAFNPNLAIEQTVASLGGASFQGDNRLSNAEIAGIAGLVAGILIGLALAAWRDSPAVARRTRLATRANHAA
jgi:capsular polysaccharide biosynthesis protein